MLFSPEPLFLRFYTILLPRLYSSRIRYQHPVSKILTQGTLFAWCVTIIIMLGEVCLGVCVCMSVCAGVYVCVLVYLYTGVPECSRSAVLTAKRNVCSLPGGDGRVRCVQQRVFSGKAQNCKEMYNILACIHRVYIPLYCAC